MRVPDDPWIYHITHVTNLAGMVADGGLWSDAGQRSRRPESVNIGYRHIKDRRMQRLVTAGGRGKLGEYVPFYFCPRSVMLYLIHKRNPELAYKGGQEPIVHLEADLFNAVAWAQANGRRWAFTLSNAGSYYFEDRADLAQLGEIDWGAVASTQWPAVKERKQAEFLMEHSFPWQLIERIGVYSAAINTQVAHALPVGGHRPPVAVLPAWYY